MAELSISGRVKKARNIPVPRPAIHQLATNSKEQISLIFPQSSIRHSASAALPAEAGGKELIFSFYVD
jgi:hypothetical protein